MIHFLSPKVVELLNDFRDFNNPYIPISLTVCEGTGDGHLRILCEASDTLEGVLDLGDCIGLSDEQMNERFVKEFSNYAYRYSTSEERDETLSDSLMELAEDLKSTLPKDNTTYLLKLPVVGELEIIPYDPDKSLELLQTAVGGYIESAPIPTSVSAAGLPLDCYVDEEGLLKGLPLNTRLSAWAKQYLVGDAVFAAHDDEGNTVGLTMEDIDRIKGLI